METIKRKILLEDSIDRGDNSPTYGVMTATSFYVKVMLTQDVDDMGLFTDQLYIPNDGINQNPADYSILNQKLNSMGLLFPFMTGGTPTQMTGITGTTAITLRLTGYTAPNYYFYGNSRITGATDSRIEDVKSYSLLNPYQVGFNTAAEVYTGYNGTIVNGVNRVSYLGEPTIYVFEAENDPTLGQPTQTTGLQYKDYSGLTRNIIVDGQNNVIPLTTISYIGEGFNETNTSLSALTKEEYLFGIISPPEVESDVFIDRGATTVMEKHLRLSEVKNLTDLVRHGNGFYNLTRI